MERLDKNLSYRVKRYPPQPDLDVPVETEHYKKTGIMRAPEIKYENFNKRLSGGAGDQNIFQRMMKFKAQQPILPQRVIKDLDPKTRIRSQLDLTKGERDQASIIKSLQGISNLVKDFISAPRLDLQGKPVLDPITNQPIIERRSLRDVLTVSHEALFKALSDNSVVANNNIRDVVASFTSIQIMNVLAKFRGVIEEFPYISQADKNAAFRGAIIEERMRNLNSAPEGMEEIIGTELDEEKMSEYTDNWDIDHTSEIFPTRGFTPDQWNEGWPSQKTVEEYVMLRLKRNPGEQIRSVTGGRLSVREMGRQFASDRKHVFDLQSLQFVRPTNAGGMAAMVVKHTPVQPGAPPVIAAAAAPPPSAAVRIIGPAPSRRVAIPPPLAPSRATPSRRVIAPPSGAVAPPSAAIAPPSVRRPLSAVPGRPLVPSTTVPLPARRAAPTVSAPLVGPFSRAPSVPRRAAPTVSAPLVGPFSRAAPSRAAPSIARRVVVPGSPSISGKLKKDKPGNIASLPKSLGAVPKGKISKREASQFRKDKSKAADDGITIEAWYARNPRNKMDDRKKKRKKG